MRKLAFVVLIGALAPGLVGFTTYDDLASWQAAVGPHSLEDFEGVPDQEIPDEGGSIVLDGFTIVADGNHRSDGGTCGATLCAPKVEDGVFVGDVHGGSGSALDFNRFEFETPISAFGLDFLYVEDDSVVVYGSGFSVWRDIVHDDPFFLGIVFDAPVTSVGISVDWAHYESDDFRWVTAVPEPGTGLLVGLGVAGLAIRPGRRRRLER